MGSDKFEDLIYGGNGDDVIFSIGNMKVYGGDGNDIISEYDDLFDRGLNGAEYWTEDNKISSFYEAVFGGVEWLINDWGEHYYDLSPMGSMAGTGDQAQKKLKFLVELKMISSFKVHPPF